MPDALHDSTAIAAHFNAEHVSTSSVRWSDEEMWRWHTRLLHELDSELLIPMIRPFVPEVQPQRLVEFAALIERNLERASDATLFQRLLAVDAALEAEALPVMREAGADFYQHALDAWQDNPEWKSWTADVKERSGAKGKALFMPLRVALSGALHGPEMGDVVAFLGSENIVARLESAKHLCLEGQAGS
jgi:glutamyl-tRNA synthetase